jgi:hypothetical protein
VVVGGHTSSNSVSGFDSSVDFALDPRRSGCEKKRWTVGDKPRKVRTPRVRGKPFWFYVAGDMTMIGYTTLTLSIPNASLM